MVNTTGTSSTGAGMALSLPARFRRLRRIRLFFPLSVFLVVALIAAGCLGAPPIRGWAGPVEHNGILYVASMQGKVFAVDPAARALGSPFPAFGEWMYPREAGVPLRAPARATGLACAPAPAGSGVYGNPALGVIGEQQFVYVGTDSGKVFALDAVSGEYRWEHPHEPDRAVGPIIGTPVVVGSNVIFGSSDGHIYAVNAATGDRAWQFDAGDQIWSSPVVLNENILFGTFGGRGFAISALNGSELWRVSLDAAIASVSAANDIVLFGTFDNILHAFDARLGGRPLWTFEADNWFWAPPLISGETIYASNMDGFLYAIDRRGGSQIWRFDAGSPIAARPLLRDNQLLVAAQNGDVFFLGTAGQERMRTSLRTEIMAPPFLSNGIMYVHGRDQVLYSINVDNGEVTWRYSLTPQA